MRALIARMSRFARHIVVMALCVGAWIAIESRAFATERLFVAGFGGVIEEVFRKEIFPPFEKKHDVKIEYIPAVSSVLLSRLRAQKDNQELDMVQLVSLPLLSALEQDLCAPITDAVTLDKLPKHYLAADNKALTWGVLAASLTYNKKYFEKQGWAAPVSWNDLRDPKYRKKIMLPTFSTDFGIFAIAMLSRINGGSEANPDVGFKILSEEVRPNVLSFDAAPGKSAELYQTEQAVLGVWSYPRVAALQAQGVPMEFVYPKEGAIAVPLYACKVKKQKVHPLTEPLLAHIMSDDMQIIIARSLQMSPTSKTVVLPPDVAKAVMSADEAVKQLVKLDHATINKNMETWFRRWQREVER